MQVPLAALSAAAAMKPSVTSAASALVAGAAVSGADVIGLCRSFSYADGGIYCRRHEGTGCISDLGDFPAKRSFRLNIVWSQDKSIYLAEEKGTSHRDPTRRDYVRYKDKLGLDASPGAFAPLFFTPDNGTLAGGETTWAWTGAIGIILWTPTGDPADATPGEAITGQGFAWADVEGYPGLQRAYWNHTLWGEVAAGRADGALLGLCYGDLRADVEMGEHP